MNLVSSVESVLFVAGKPLLPQKIALSLQTNVDEVLAVLKTLQTKYNTPESGIKIIELSGAWQMVSDPNNSAAAEQFIKTELSEELTRAQLETLTVISYLGPITRAKLEQIRGVNSSVIIRNLLLRGLIQENPSTLEMLPEYQVTMEYIMHLGLTKIQDLPSYEEFRNHPYLLLKSL